MSHTTFEHHGTVAEREPEIVQGFEMKREGGLDFDAGVANLGDDHQLKNHDLAVELTEDREALGIALVAGAGHRAATIAQDFFSSSFPRFSRTRQFPRIPDFLRRSLDLRIPSYMSARGYRESLHRA